LPVAWLSSAALSNVESGDVIVDPGSIFVDRWYFDELPYVRCPSHVGVGVA